MKTTLYNNSNHNIIKIIIYLHIYYQKDKVLQTLEAPQNKINSYQANHREDNTKQRNHAITISYHGLNCFFY